ncbi:short-chain dehydrogenase/reductase [Streptomyces sp. NPDC001070]
MAGTSPLKDHTAVVTGAARGIGRGVARALAARGARVALLGLEQEELEAAAADLPGAALAWCVDVTDEAALRDAADRVTRGLGPASVVVSNAGVAGGAPFVDSDMGTWRRIVEVNLVGSALTAHAFLPALITTCGYYLQISSLAAMGAAPLMSGYCASKAGVESFAHSLRAEVAHRGVDVGVAYLSWTDTEMIRDAQRHATLRELRALMPWPASRTYSVEATAERLARGIERRAPAVYAQPWLRGVQAVRVLLPGLVTWRARRALGALEQRPDITDTGLLGAGGRADAIGGCGVSGGPRSRG